MEENIKVAYTKNLNKLNFNQTISVPIDANANIKTVLDINAFLFDTKVECGSGKAIISGKVGVKVLYLDTDNMTNTISESASFSETVVDASITADAFLNVLHRNISHTILSTEGTLKINCEVSISPVCYLNLKLNNSLSQNEMLITKKSEIKTSTISQCLNTTFEHFQTVETADSINKILCNNSYFAFEKVTACDGYFVVEGKMCSVVVYETTKNDETQLKEIKDCVAVKCDVAVDGLKADSDLDFSFMIDKNREEISTEIEDKNSVVTIKHQICVTGTVLTPITLDLVDDLFSTTNEIETTLTTREYCKTAQTFNLTDTFSNEINLLSDETAIDEIISNLNTTTEITNTYLKDNIIFVEGVITSNLTYVDENKELKAKILISPFILNTKVQANSVACVHTNISVVDTHVKVKRGTIIETETTLNFNLTLMETENHEMVDNFTLGKALDFSKYDFQIFIGKQGETLWSLCKRVKISPDEIQKYNKDLPLIMEGGERVVIKR